MHHHRPEARIAVRPSKFEPAATARMACLCLAALAGAAQADEPPTQAAAQAVPDAAPLKLAQLFGPRSDLLAAAAPAVASGPATSLVTPAAPGRPFEAPFFTGSNAHKYLGLGTLALVALTGLTAPHESCEGNCPAGTPPRQTSGTTHTRLARAASVMAAATVASGLLVHWDDFHLRDGFSDPDNQHALLALAGSLLMMQAVNRSMHSAVPTQHAGTAALGGVAMAVAVKLTW